jgi:hypothetical protein
VVVRAIDQDDLRARLPECFGGCQSAKSTADNDDSWLSHLLLTIRFGPRSFLLRAGAENNATGSRLEHRKIHARVQS